MAFERCEGIYLVVFVDEVQATVVRDERCNLLAVLNQLHTNALPHSRVRLLGLDTTVKSTNGTLDCALQSHPY